MSESAADRSACAPGLTLQQLRDEIARLLDQSAWPEDVRFLAVAWLRALPRRLGRWPGVTELDQLWPSVRGKAPRYRAWRKAIHQVVRERMLTRHQHELEARAATAAREGAS